MTKAPKYTETFQDAAGRMSLPWRRWVDSVDAATNAGASAASAADIAAIATALGSPDGTVANIPDQDTLDGVIYGGAGITVTGKLGQTPVYISLNATADLIAYDNTASGLAAEDVQAAIDEVASGVGVPTVMSAGQTFTVPANRQVLFAIPIDVGLGTLDVSGDLVEVS